MTALGPIALRGTVQHYPWGRLGSQSLVAQLAGACDEGLPYAELWIGAHPKSPSIATYDGEDVSLDRLLVTRTNSILGDRVQSSFGSLPFLLKVLSVNRALSIQAHPDKALARSLHARDPKNYPDSNHKPEVGIALTEVQLLYGFRSIQEIATDAIKTPELAMVLGYDTVQSLVGNTASSAELLRASYSSIICGDRELRTRQMERLLSRLLAGEARSKTENLVLTLSASCSIDDVGLFSCFLLNTCEVQAGQGMYIGPNIPHAYLSGELLECMANSDNVVRAGLTTKYQDAETLLHMLEYEVRNPEIIIPGQNGECIHKFDYHVPVAEFRISELRGAGEYSANPQESPVLIFCLEGAVTAYIGDRGASCASGRGILIPAAATEYRICSEPGSRAFLVSVP